MPRERRGRLLDESVEVIRRLWTESHVDHDGPCFSFRDVTVEPRPVQRPHPPIWFGSIGPEAHEFNPLVKRVLDRIARLGDGWVPLTYSTHAKEMTDPRLLGRAWQRIEEGMCARGRDPGRFEIIYSHWCYVTTGEAGERARCEEAVRRWFDGSLEEARRTYLVGTPDEIAAGSPRAPRTCRGSTASSSPPSTTTGSRWTGSRKRSCRGSASASTRRPPAGAAPEV